MLMLNVIYAVTFGQYGLVFLQSVIPGRPDEVIVVHIDLIIDASQDYIEFVDAEGWVKGVLAAHTE